MSQYSALLSAALAEVGGVGLVQYDQIRFLLKSWLQTKIILYPDYPHCPVAVWDLELSRSTTETQQFINTVTSSSPSGTWELSYWGNGRFALLDSKELVLHSINDELLLLLLLFQALASVCQDVPAPPWSLPSI